MFTLLAFGMIAVIAFRISYANKQDRPLYEAHSDEPNWLLFLHMRQDLVLVAYLIGGVIIMLGIVADRIH